MSAVALLAGAGVGSASAHANLVHCSIKNNQVFTKAHVPKRITGVFAESLDPKRSWIKVFEGEGDHGLVTEKQKSVVDYTHPTHMNLALPTLGKGKYAMIWYTSSAEDGHIAAGIVSFTVK